MHLPEGAFVDMLIEEGVYVMPGADFETPGYFRICLTANDAMIEGGLPGFARAGRRGQAHRTAAAPA